MMLYNTVDYPVIVMLGDQTYRMERDSELELKIPSGDYPFRIHKVDRKGRPILQRVQGGGRVPGFRYGRRYRSEITIICLAATALLTVRKDTKIYFREQTEPLISISSERFKQEVFDILIENGEMNHRCDGYLDESVRNKMITKFKWEVIGSCIGQLLLIAACVVLLSLLPGALRENGLTLTQTDWLEILPIALAPLLCVFFFIRDISQFHKFHIFQDIPVLPEVIDYDFV